MKGAEKSIIVVFVSAVFEFPEKLLGEVEGREGSDRRELEEELADLDSLLPDLDAKVSQNTAE